MIKGMINLSAKVIKQKSRIGKILITSLLAITMVLSNMSAVFADTGGPLMPTIPLHLHLNRGMLPILFYVQLLVEILQH